jgi:hypothetical protein
VGHTNLSDFANSAGGTNPCLRPLPPVGEPRCISSSLLLTYTRNKRPLVILPRAKQRAGEYDALCHTSIAPQTHVSGSCSARVAASSRRQTTSFEAKLYITGSRHAARAERKPQIRKHDCNTQNVTILADRKTVLLRICEKSEGGRDERPPTCAVKQLPTVFRGDLKSNLPNASRWAKIHHEYIAETRRCENAAYRAGGGRLNRVRIKSRSGRERKTIPWVEVLYPDLYSEFYRLKKLGVKLSPKMLETVARTVLAESAHDLLGRGALQIGKDGEKELFSQK